ncbi:unnamed protein product [marine sediment metagenome]|uniref:Uncharacterized protein n=1 Tax=marine sediment metagenome TaxID=412755 RepID=X1PS93_9ZZZZ
MAEIFPVETRGVGKPDYSREVSAGRERAGISLKYNQQLLAWGLCWTDMVDHPQVPAVPWVKPRLAPGAPAHLIDFATGVAVPYVTPAGYAFTMVQKDWTCNEDIEIWLYGSTPSEADGGSLVLIACPGISPSGDNVYVNPVYTYTSLTLDPTSAYSHSWDVVVVNKGVGDMEGGIVFAAIMEAVGTSPFPDTKQCRCPLCQHLQTVKVGTTIIVCANCGETYYVQDFSKIRGL